MKAILITPKSAKDLQLITDLMRRLGIDQTTLSLDDMEDIAMYRAIQEADHTKTVSRETIMKKLKVK